MAFEGHGRLCTGFCVALVHNYVVKCLHWADLINYVMVISLGLVLFVVVFPWIF